MNAQPPIPDWPDSAGSAVPAELTMTTGRVNLGNDAAGRFDAYWADDWDQGWTEYTLDGPRLSGTVTVWFALPAVWSATALREIDRAPQPFLVCSTSRVDHSDPGEWILANRVDHLTVNNIAIDSKVQTSEAGFDQSGLQSAREFHVRRRDAATTRDGHVLPSVTFQRAAAVMNLVVDHWRHRHPEVDLMRMHRVQAHVDDLREGIAQRQQELKREIRAFRQEITALNALEANADDIGRLPLAVAALADFTRLTTRTEATANDAGARAEHHEAPSRFDAPKANRGPRPDRRGGQGGRTR
jgi:hypothetical protein